MWIAILYVLASLVALYGVYILYGQFKTAQKARVWLLFGAAFLFYALLMGILAYRAWKRETPWDDLAGGLTSLTFSVLIIVVVMRIKDWMHTLAQSEEQSRKEQELYRSIIENLPTPVVFKDREMVYRAVNPCFGTFLGKTELEMLGKKDSDFFPRPQANAFLRSDEQVLQLKMEQVDEQEVMGLSGKKWLELIRRPVPDNNGGVSGVLVFGRDITDRKRLEGQLNEQKYLIQNLASEKQQIVDTNRQALDFQKDLLNFARLLVSIAGHFIVSNPEHANEDTQRSLHLIGSQIGVDRCEILVFDNNTGCLDVTYEWIAKGVPDRKTKITSYLNPPWVNLAQMQVFQVPNLTHLPPDAHDVAEFMQTRGIESFTVVPLITNRLVIGYLWLDSIHSRPLWNREMLDLLRTAGQVLVNALERRKTIAELIDAQEDAQRRLASLEQHDLENALLNELGDLLQVCRTVDEAYPVIARYTQQLVPVGSGALYLVRDLDDPVERVAAWGDPAPAELELVFNECWALRRGRLHMVQDSRKDLNCAHLKLPLPPKYLCIPLIAQGETIGLLHLRPAKGETASLNAHLDDYQRVSQVIAEHIALALSNLSLRDKLRSQAIRDPLTGLYNRRYMEETLEREIRRAIRHASPVSVIMFDIDHLKQINDKFGHDAGDVVLKILGDLLIKLFRGEDVPCRYGGDEFTIVLPEASVSEAFRRAEQFRETFKKTDFVYEGRTFSPLTLSLGIAAYPDHGASVERLLQTADAASYTAKLQGRDRVMIGGFIEE